MTRRKRVAGKGPRRRPSDATPAPGGFQINARRVSEPTSLVLALGLLLLSGFAGLVYEVLWMRELGLLFGNTAQAAATTLGAFFLGLAAGGLVWGRRASRIGNTLRAYGLLEAAVATSALLYFMLLETYRALYGPLFELLGAEQRGLFVAVKFFLALGVLFPPAFFMGGTLPVMSQNLVRRAGTLGQTGALVYAVNTLGAALGAYAAAFYLPLWLGFTGSYWLAIGVSAGVALGARWLSHHAIPATSASPASGEVRAAQSIRTVAPAGTLRTLAFVSGFGALALQVLWTRMFAQVLQNSVYTFAAILVVFLLSLALGAVVASRLARSDWNPITVLSLLLLASALGIITTPFAFDVLTNGLSYLGGSDSWDQYVLKVFGVTAAVIGPPSVVLGSLFPYLLKASEPLRLGAGRSVGDLVAVNTLGAIAGAVAAGFVVLETVGLWGGIWLMAAAYLLAALLLPVRAGLPALRATAAVFLMLLAGIAQVRLPLVHVSAADGETVTELLEGSAATVAVVEQRGSVKLKINNHYALGGTAAAKWETWQAHLPLLLHPAPRSVFFLGMGTGITAGAALSHPVQKVVVTEVVPEVVTAARSHFGDYTGALFEDKRAQVVVEDGRNYVLGTREHFDVVVADLFMPWKAGTGSLYTREHYRAVRERLAPGGVFMQWLPLYQMSAREFGTIARTIVESFPLVTVWRGDFFSHGPILGLAGMTTPAPVDPRALSRRLAQAEPAVRELPLLHFLPDLETIAADTVASPDPSRLLLYYCGNLTTASDLVAHFPINTDDWPVLEYMAPVSERGQASGEETWFVAGQLIDFLDRLQTASPAYSDPYLSRLTASEKRFVQAGLNFHRMQVLVIEGDRDGARRAWQGFSGIALADLH